MNRDYTRQKAKSDYHVIQCDCKNFFYKRLDSNISLCPHCFERKIKRGKPALQS